MLHAQQRTLDLSDIIDAKRATLTHLEDSESILWFRNTAQALRFVTTARGANLQSFLVDSRPISVSVAFGQAFTLMEKVRLVGSILATVWGDPVLSSDITDSEGIDFRPAQGSEKWKA